MGGRAFPYLHCPRIPRETYLKAREQATDALRKLFRHVVVPTEMPSKPDYGDVDFLVSDFVYASSDAPLDWPMMVSKVKEAFNTDHSNRGHLNPFVIFSAVPSPITEDNFWVQIDVKVCPSADKQTFEWERFQLNYASGSKMIGSLLKPLGFTINPEGLYIRVEEMEDTNFPGSMVFVSKEPKDVLKLVDLDQRLLTNGFESNVDIYEYFASSCIFNPAHFAARLEHEKYEDHLEERSAPWVSFVKEWIPQHYSGYRLPDQDVTLEEWYMRTRAAIREKVFTLLPRITPEYYTKRSTHLKEVEEKRLRELLMKAIPSRNEECDLDFPHLRIIIRPVELPNTPPTMAVVQSNDSALAVPLLSELLPNANGTIAPKTSWSSSEPALVEVPPSWPLTPPSSVESFSIALPSSQQDPRRTLLYLDALPRDPPICFTARPPSASMSIEARLLCIARWTYFDPDTGMPFLAMEPREKKFEMSWADSGASDDTLVQWVNEMWTVIWYRQARVNYVGMWKSRFGKEDAKAEKARQMEAKAEVEKLDNECKAGEVEEKREKISKRLKMMNQGVVEDD